MTPHPIVGAICLALAICLGLVTIWWAAWQKGYEHGRKDEADWWIGVEKQVDQAAQKIGRHEG